MSAETNYTDMILHLTKLTLHTYAPAKVLEFYEDEQAADIELLFMSADRTGALRKYPIILKAPVQGMRYKIPNPFPADITGLVGFHGDVNGGAAVVAPSKEIEFVPFLKPGDIVTVAFAERAMDNLQDEPFDPQFKRTHNIKDAIITGILFL